MALIHDNRIPPFPATTLSTNHFRWLQEGDWSDPEWTYFASERSGLSLGIFAPPPVFRDGTKPHLRRVGRWVLNPFPQNAEVSVGWAEVQLVQGSFRTGTLFLGRPGSGEFSALDAWSLLISSVFVQWSLDTLRVIPIYMPLSTLAPLGGKAKTLWTPQHAEGAWLDKGIEPLVAISTQEFEPGAWWAGERGKKDKTTLSYLQRRRSKYDEEQRCRCSS